MTPRELEEYRALRATIRERGTTRVWIFFAGLAVWGGLAVATTAVASPPIAILLPLLALAAAFEAVLSLHVGVERIGRYIQVFFEAGEDAAGPPVDRKWEHVAMACGRASGGASTDPLFVLVFASATFLNLVPVLTADPVAVELAVVGGAHALFIVRLLVARRDSARQRDTDLDRFQQLRQRRG
jgi:hypothetical protein